MHSAEEISHRPLACFKIDNLKFFHTGDFKRCVKPTTSEEYKKFDYSLITFHVFIQTSSGECYLLAKTGKSKHSFRESTFSTQIEYSHPFTYEYMEAFVVEKFTQVYGFAIEDLRFQKMQMEKTPQGTFELVYYLLGIVNIPMDEDKVEKFAILTRDQILQEARNPSLKLWIKILESGTELPKHTVEPQKNPIGIIIGRFQPVHLGHISLIRKALEHTPFLKIGIGSSQLANQSKNPFSFDVRKHFIELSLFDEKIPKNAFQIYPIPDLFDFDRWIDSIFDIVGTFDVIFTNNLWIGRLIQQKGKALKYGWKYNFTKYNGTYIRRLLKTNDPEWKSLVPPSIIPILEAWIAKKTN